MTRCDEQAVNFLYAAIGQLTFGAKMFEFETFSRSLDTLCLVPAIHCTRTRPNRGWELTDTWNRGVCSLTPRAC